MVSIHKTELNPIEELKPLWQELQEGKRVVSLQGILGSSRAFLLALFLRQTKRSLLILVPEIAQGRELYQELSFFLNPLEGGAERVLSAWAKEVHFFSYEESNLGAVTGEIRRDGEVPPREIPLSKETIGERLEVLEQLRSGRKVAVVAPVAAIMRRVPSRKALTERVKVLRLWDRCERQGLVDLALEGGYRRSDLVEERGELAVRGGIVDLYPPGYPNPLRIELDDDLVESIREFDPTSQKSIRLIEEAVILPLKEQLDRAEGLQETLFDYLPPNGMIVLDDALAVSKKVQLLEEWIQEGRPSLLNEGKPQSHPPLNGSGGASRPPSAPATHHRQSEENWEEGVSPSSYLDLEEFQLYLEESQLLRLYPLGLTEVAAEEDGSGEVHSLTLGPVGYYQGRFPDLARQVRQWQREGFSIAMVCLSRGQAIRLKSLLEEYGVNVTGAPPGPPIQAFEGLFQSIPTSSPARVFVGRLSGGFLLPGLKAAVLVEDEIFGLRQKRPPIRHSKKDLFLSNFADLKPNDYVVHVDYGIGQYLGITKLETAGNAREFLEIEYSEGDKLYVPLDRLNLVHKYVGGEATAPPLEKLGHSSWRKLKGKVKGSLRELARELLRIYAAREISPGNAFSSDNHWHQEFDSLFEYEETPDQLQAIQEVKADMEKPRPMDRLVCGDVGYGKTEVAMRAAFKSVMDRKQVAVLVPTTILAQQHLATFRRRFAPYPARIEMLSRFKSRPEQKEIIRGIEEGSVHIVIGTHRLLQKDLQFKDLGLLIVDEEQRFGVAHKEKLKQLRKTVAVLTLTATPIPRTLHLSMVGVRDMSIIETPPENRLPIKTYIKKFDEGVIREAILRELERGGQVFFVHNRTENIEAMRKSLQQLVPQVRVGIAHGQMPERDLERIMLRFLEGEFDLLLSTSIIESGLDIPSVNTIIINRADHFGLAQLYQLRGRVGRAQHQAYAYLMIPGEDLLSEVAKKRLQAIKELSGLGSGFLLASRDMEIRGAGNILGSEQSGNMSAIGFELYCKLLEEAIRELKGEASEDDVEPELLLGLEGYIPEDYISNANQRLDVYKRLSDIREPEDLQWIQEELIDRYGALPEALGRLLQILEIKDLARKLRIIKLERQGDRVLLTFNPQVTLIPFERFEREGGEGNLKDASSWSTSHQGDLSGLENLTRLEEYVLELKLRDGSDKLLQEIRQALNGLKQSREL
ncbi:MAG: transcription-repair coupling factor [Nitrospinae bacterium]|nr:transcription-repair coupling factor [Nitrospinota bacterium]